MADILVKLYKLPSLQEALERVEKQGIIIRRPIGAEKENVIKWIGDTTISRWAGESEVAFFNSPRTMYIALKPNREDGSVEMLGFACWDATAKGFFGPTAVHADWRGKGLGIGKALLLSCLYGMREDGYGYAIIGGTGPHGQKFYQHCLPDATIIEDSAPGIYDWMI